MLSLSLKPTLLFTGGPGLRSGWSCGVDGFGFERDDNGNWANFPQIGGVVIEDDVEVGANACIDPGTLGDTVIGPGTKIGNLAYIAHNIKLGQRCIVVALAISAGSVVVGNDTWIGP